VQEALTPSASQPEPAPARPTRVPTAPPAESAPAPAGAEAQPWAAANGDFDYYVLALSWQPAFCETKPHKTECSTQTARRFDATNFALHGLWPNVIGDSEHSFGYCNVPQAVIRQDNNGDWCEMPALDLAGPVWEELTVTMPGTASCLHHHEWYKHGTCAGMDENAYFALANHLTHLFAQTNFNRYVGERVGQTVTRQELLAQFEAEFGPAAGNYLSLRCSKDGGESLLSEVQLALKKDLAEVDDWANLFPAQKVPVQGNCPSQFKIDRAGKS
jgi:ribonuclease T2